MLEGHRAFSRFHTTGIDVRRWFAETGISPWGRTQTSLVCGEPYSSFVLSLPMHITVRATLPPRLDQLHSISLADSCCSYTYGFQLITELREDDTDRFLGFVRPPDGRLSLRNRINQSRRTTFGTLSNTTCTASVPSMAVSR